MFNMVLITPDPPPHFGGSHPQPGRSGLGGREPPRMGGCSPHGVFCRQKHHHRNRDPKMGPGEAGSPRKTTKNYENAKKLRDLAPS
jgi:hypothetical protein